MDAVKKHLSKIKNCDFSDEGKLAKEITCLAFEFFRHPDNEMTIKAEYIHYDRVYKIGNYEKELPMCIVCSWRLIGLSWAIIRGCYCSR